MTPAGTTKQKDPDPALLEEEAVLEDQDLEVPAIGEAVAYVTVDPNTGAHEEHAAQITYVSEDGVDLVVFARHARQGRPFQNVPFINNPELVGEQRQYWHYPEVPALEDADVPDADD